MGSGKFNVWGYQSTPSRDAAKNNWTEIYLKIINSIFLTTKTLGKSELCL